MPNTTINIPRPHLIMGLCLPLAVLIGYLLAEPLESGSLAVIIVIFSILTVPILIKWHHPLLIASWNACITPYFLPGRPALWMLLAVASLVMAVLHRATDPGFRFIAPPAITRPLLALAAVIFVTCVATGGFGMRILGSNTYGGRNYFYLGMAIIGYFALCSRPIPRHAAGFYTALFFLPGLGSVISHLAYMAGAKFYVLYQLFPPEFAEDQAAVEGLGSGLMVRLSGLTFAAQALYWFILARYGIKGIFDFGRPWRLVILGVTIFAALLGGFRSALLLMLETFVILFFLEKLWRTGLVWAVLIWLVLTGAGLLLFGSKLPLSAQRSLTFLPIRVDPVARTSADHSNEWRLAMWKFVIPEVPKYLLKGKGYSMDPTELYLVTASSARGLTRSEEGAAYAGDYHNGPLSVLMPFGIYGLVAFLWLLVRGTTFLWHNFRYGDPALTRINALLLAAFLARIFSFFVIAGSLYSDLFYFTGLLGIGCSLNWRPATSTQPEFVPSFRNDLAFRTERVF